MSERFLRRCRDLFIGQHCKEFSSFGGLEGELKSYDVPRATTTRDEKLKTMREILFIIN
jgi:hypothetical protein